MIEKIKLFLPKQHYYISRFNVPKVGLVVAERQENLLCADPESECRFYYNLENNTYNVAKTDFRQHWCRSFEDIHNMDIACAAFILYVLSFNSRFCQSEYFGGKEDGKKNDYLPIIFYRLQKVFEIQEQDKTFLCRYFIGHDNISLGREEDYLHSGKIVIQNIE